MILPTTSKLGRKGGIINMMSSLRNAKRKKGYNKYAVDQIVHRALTGRFYRLFVNMTFMGANGKPFLFDYLILTQSGIIAIETKYIEGILHGHAQDSIWSCVPLKGLVSRVPNPHPLNEKLASRLRAVLGENAPPIVAYTVFTHSKLMLDIKSRVPEGVFNLAMFAAHMSKWSQIENVISDIELEEWHEQISKLRKTDEVLVEKQHNYARNLRRMRKERKVINS